MVLLVLHSVISFASYRFFTVRTLWPEGKAPVDISTPEQKAAGEKVIQFTEERRFTPMPVIFYIFGGYVALGATVVFSIFIWLRNI